MKKGKLIGKILGIAVVFVLVGAMLSGSAISGTDITSSIDVFADSSDQSPSPLTTITMAGADRTEIFAGQGFDTCEIPTISQMQAWMTYSPYDIVNLYIGGSCRSCSNSALTASYVSQLSQQGWKFIPTWVGPQSACWSGSCGSSISNDPATAYNQGISEADAAIDVAINLGLASADGSGTIIYYDLEVYDTTNAACHDAAKSFISGWTAQIHARGSKAGVYGYGPAINDLASIDNVPDAIWPAHWIYDSYNSGATVWDVYGLSNSLWADHQRIRQYAGNVIETYGGVTLNIDCNVIDGIVATIAAQPSIDLSLVSLYAQSFPFIYLTVRASSDGQPINDLTKDNFSVTEDGRLQTDMFDVVPPEEGGGVRMADIVFLIDTSGSMGYEIAAVRDNCVAFANALAGSDIDYRLGLVRFGNGSGANPGIIGDGLTDNAETFKSWVGTLGASGSYEPGFAAIRLAIQSYSFRPGSQKVFVLITDEESDDRDKQTTIDMIMGNDVTVHVAVDCAYSTSEADYCGVGSIRDVSGGLQFPVTGDYRSILDTIGEAVANAYIVRYRTDNPVLDGLERTVVCTVQDGTATDYVECTYIPGGTPHIQRTEETLALHEQSLVASSSPTISVEVTDTAAPFVEDVFLYVRTSGSGTGYVQISMLMQGNNIYSAAVPSGYVNAPGLDYYIRATDGQVTSSDPTTEPAKNPYQIAVLPNEAPVIVHTPPASWQTGDDVNLEISASDSTYGIAGLNVYFRKQGDLLWQSVSESYGPTNTAISENVLLPVAAWNTEAIEYYIKVTDDFGVYKFWPEGGADDPYLLTATLIGISGVQVSKIGMNTATITWRTNEPATSEVDYGATTPPSSTVSSSELTSSHELVLVGLNPGTTYFFQVKSADAAGNTATDNNGGSYYSFTTPDKLLPVPYMYQGATNWCYLYSLAMVLQYYGHNIHAYQIANDWNLGNQEGAGSLASVVTRYTKKYVEKTLKLELDVSYDVLAVYFDYYKTRIDKNVPVIVVDPVITDHAAVVVGYQDGPTDDDRYLYLHDPSGSWVTDLEWNPTASHPLMYVKVPMKEFRDSLLLSPAYNVIIEGSPNYPSGVMYLTDLMNPEQQVHHAAEDSSVQFANKGELYLNNHLDWVWGLYLGGSQEILAGSEYLSVGAIIINHTEQDRSYRFIITIEDNKSGEPYNTYDLGTMEVPRLSQSPISTRILSSLSKINPGEYSLYLDLYGTSGDLYDNIGPIPIRIASTGVSDILSIQIPNKFIGGDVSFYVNMYAYSHQYDDGKWYWTFYADPFTRISSTHSDLHLDSSVEFQLIVYRENGRQLYRTGWLSTDTDGDGVYGDCGPLGGHTQFVKSPVYGKRITDSLVFKTIWRDKYQRWWLTSEEIECLTLSLP